MATTIPVWQTPRLQYTVETNVTATDFERIEGNILNLRNTGKPFAVTMGDNNLYSATITDIPTLVEGIGIRLKIHKTNTAQAYLNLNNLGNIEILKNDLQPTVANDLRAGQLIDISYIGGKWQLVGATQFVPVANADDIYQEVFHGGIAMKQSDTVYTMDIPNLILTKDKTKLAVAFNATNILDTAFLNINSQGNIPIKNWTTKGIVDVYAGELLANSVHLLVYRDSYFEVVSGNIDVQNLKTAVAESRLEISMLRLELAQKDIIDFIKTTGYGFSSLLLDSSDIDVGSTSATFKAQ